MKTLLLFVVTLALPTAALAADDSHASPAPPAAGRTAGELVALEQFLDLSDAELAQAEQVIARLRAMTPAERDALRREISTYRKLPEPQRLRLRRGWGGTPPDLQADWREMMHTATPERREQIQARLQSLPPDEKISYRRSLIEEYRQSKTVSPTSPGQPQK